MIVTKVILIIIGKYTEFITDNYILTLQCWNRGQGPALEAIEYWQYNAGTPNFGGGGPLFPPGAFITIHTAFWQNINTTIG